MKAAPSASEMPTPPPPSIGPSRANEGKFSTGDESFHPLRRVLRIHAAVVQGQELDLILADERTARRELDERVADFARQRAEIGWFQRYLRETGKLDFRARRAGNGASVPWALPREAGSIQRDPRLRSDEGENYL